MAHSNFAAIIAADITTKLTERDMAVYVLADKAGIARTTMQRRLIDGEFTPSELKRVAAVLGVDVLSIIEAAERVA